MIWLLRRCCFAGTAIGTELVTTHPGTKKRASNPQRMEVEGVELVALEKETAHAMALNNSASFSAVSV